MASNGVWLIVGLFVGLGASIWFWWYLIQKEEEEERKKQGWGKKGKWS